MTPGHEMGGVGEVAEADLVSKRLGSRYRSGRSPDWLNFKNPEAPDLAEQVQLPIRSPFRDQL